MHFSKIAEDVWTRFCGLDEIEQREWIENYSESDVMVIHSENLNQFLKDMYKDDFVDFLNDMKQLDGDLSDLDTSKKWICISAGAGEILCTDNLKEAALFYCNLLSDMKYLKLAKWLGYTLKEAKTIKKALNKLSNEEMTHIWEHVIVNRVFTNEIEGV